jgi:predicted esterase
MRSLLLLVPLLALGCDTGSRSSDTGSTSTAGATSSSTPFSTSAGTSPVPSAGSTPATPAAPSAPTGVVRLSPGDPGVQTGLQLLRNEITPNQAVTAWTADGLTPQEVQDLLGRLPLTQAQPAGVYTPAATIADDLGRTSDLSLVVPSSPPPSTGYPVIVYLHGLGQSSTSVSSAAALIKNAIIVAPSAQDPPPSVVFEDSAPVPGLNAFPHWWVYRDHAFAMRALDWVRERYEIDSNRIVLFGPSMGGFGTWNIGLRFADRFAKLVSAAGGISRLEFAIADPISRSLLANVAMVPVWFGHGDADTVVPVSHSRTIAGDLKGLGLAYTYREIAGGTHDASTFAQLGGEVQAQLDSSLRNPNPGRVSHRAIGDYHLGAYWVVMDKAGSVVGSVSGQTITVTTADGATGATVYIDEDLVDVTQPVKVLVNGTTVLEAIPTPSLQAVASSFARTRDPLLTYRFVVMSR